MLIDLENGGAAFGSEAKLRQGSLIDSAPIGQRIDVFLGIAPTQHEIPLAGATLGHDR